LTITIAKRGVVRQ